MMKTESPQQVEAAGSAFAGYKARITEALERERQRILKDAERDFARTIAEARQAAQNTVAQAETRAKQEYKDRVRREAERGLAASREEAASIVGEARREALERSSKTLTDAGHEARRLAEALLAEARKAADEAAGSASGLKAQAEPLALETRERALHEAEQIVKDAADTAAAEGAREEERIVAEAQQRGRLIIEDARAKAQGVVEAAVRAADQAIQILTVRSEGSGPREAGGSGSVGPAPVQSPDPAAGPAGVQDRGELFQGSIELEVTTEVDAAELTQWVAMLRNIPGQRVLSVQSAAPGSPYKFLILNNAPIPLLSILKAMPLVESATKQDNKKVAVTLSGGRGAKSVENS